MDDERIEKIKAAVLKALPLRPPKWPTEGAPHPREKIEQLENYLLESAFARAELEESVHWLTALVERLTEQVERITGYETLLPNKRTERITRQDVLAAKRRVSPVLFELGGEMRQLRTTALRQIDRLQFEEQWVISRAYTMISGGS